MNDGTTLSAEAAHAIHDVLVAYFGVREDARDDFVHSQTTGAHTEYRVGGRGGFGGKFWRGQGWRPDGRFGEVWYVNAYQEDTTEAVQQAIDATNAALADVMRQHLTVL